MKRLAIGVLSALALVLPVEAQYVAPGNMPSGLVLGHCTLSVTTVITLGSACTIPFGTRWAWIENEGTAFRFWSDGTVPTTGVGFASPAGAPSAPSYTAIAASITQTQIVAQSGTSVLNIEFIQ